MRRLLLVVAVASVSTSIVLASRAEPPTPTPAARASAAPVAPSPVASAPSADAGAPAVSLVVDRARLEVARRVSYDPAWFPISYPNGDPDPGVGVCTDVVIRGYRAAGVDFQKLVHEDVSRNFAAYDPYVKVIDRNIDHRRVGPLMTYLNRHAKKLPLKEEDSYLPGDIVVISFTACPACSPQHVGVVSDKKGPRGVPLLIHNMGPYPAEDDNLDSWTRIGHYRVL